MVVPGGGSVHGSLVGLGLGLMRNGAQAPRGTGGGGGGGLFSARSLSSYMRIVSSGASTAASTLRSAGASLVNSIASHDEDAGRDQVPPPLPLSILFFFLNFSAGRSSSIASVG